MNYLGLSDTNTFYGDVLMNNNLTVEQNETIGGNLTVTGTITGAVISDPVITNTIKTLTPGGPITVENSAGTHLALFNDNGLFSVNTIAGRSTNLLLADNLGNTQMQLNNGSGSITAGVRILNGSKLNVDQIESQSYETSNNPTINFTNASINVVNVPLTVSEADVTTVKALTTGGIALKNSSNATSAQVNNDTSFQIGPYKMPLTAGANTNLLQTDGASQASWVPVVNGISNVVQETYLFTMDPNNPIGDFLYYQSGNGALDNNFFQNYPLTAIQAYSSAVTDNFTYSFNEGSTNYLVFGAAPGAFNQNPGTRVIPSVLAGATTSPNIAHMLKILSIPNPDIFVKFTLKLSMNSCWNPPSTLSVFAIYTDLPPTPQYGIQYANTCTAAGQYCDILVNDQPFGNILRTQQYDAFTSIRPSNYDFEFPLNTSGISVFQAVSIVISLNYSNNGNTNPATLVTPTGAGVISTNYTQNYGLEITRFSINAFAISNGTGTLTTDHDLLSNLGTESHTAYLTISGDRAMAGDLPMGGHKIINLLDPTSAQDAASKIYVDSHLTYSNIVYRPGGSAGGNVSITWADVIAKSAALNNAVNIYIDDSITTPAPIDISYNFGGTANILSYSNNENTINTCEIIDTVTISNISTICGFISVACIALTTVSIQLDSGSVMVLNKGATITNANTATVAGINVVTNAAIIMTDGATINNNGVPIIILPSSSVLTLDLNLLASIQNNSISSIDSSATLNIYYDAGFAAASLVNGGFTGTLTLFPYDAAVNVSFDDTQAGPNFGTNNVQQIINTLKTQTMLIGGFNAMSQNMNIGDNAIIDCASINSGVRGYSLVLGNATDGITIPGSLNGDLNAGAYNISSVATLGAANINMVGGNINCDTQFILNCGGMNPSTVGYGLVLGNPTDQISMNGTTNFQYNLNINGNVLVSSVQTSIASASNDGSGTSASAFNTVTVHSGTGTYAVTFQGVLTPIAATYQVVISAAYVAGVPVIASVDTSSKTTSGFTYYVKSLLGVLTDGGADFIVMGSN